MASPRRRLLTVTLFDVWTRRRTRPSSVVPLGFTAVAEALRQGTDRQTPSRVVGRRLAEMGVSLDEVLDGLEETYRLTGYGEPDFGSVRAVSCGWADSSLEYMNGLSCEDPLTGLATTAHLRTRLAELYRLAECDDTPPAGSHALVVVELAEPGAIDQGRETIDRALRFVDIVDAVHAVYPCGETVARVGARRAATLVRRDEALGDRVGLLRQLLADWGIAPHSHRVWIEGLPTGNDHVGRLLDDLAR